MNIAEAIKAARENLGMTQEGLAERCEVSRQAVSKWELGASVPSPENLILLEEILGIPLETGADSPVLRPSAPNPWKIAALSLGILMAAALLSMGMYVTVLKPDGTPSGGPSSPPSPPVAVPDSLEPAITGIYFFLEDGTPLNPDLGDGWNTFPTGERIYLLVSFRQGTESEAHGAALYATPTGTETYGQREQLAVQAIYDRTFALFPLEFSESTTLHLDITLECDCGQTVTETLNVVAVAEEAGETGQEGSAV